MVSIFRSCVRSSPTQLALAQAAIECGNLAEAERLLMESFTTLRVKLGDSHPDTLASASHLAAAHEKQGHVEAALKLYRYVLEERRYKLATTGQRISADLPSVLTLSSLGTLLYNENRLTEAMPLLREYHSMCRERWGDSHPETLTALHDLGRGHLQRQEMDEARKCLQGAKKGAIEVLGATHAHTLIFTKSLATLDRRCDRLASSPPQLAPSSRSQQVVGRSRSLQEIAELAEARRAKAWGAASLLLTPVSAEPSAGPSAEPSAQGGEESRLESERVTTDSAATANTASSWISLSELRTDGTSALDC